MVAGAEGLEQHEMWGGSLERVRQLQSDCSRVNDSQIQKGQCSEVPTYRTPLEEGGHRRRARPFSLGGRQEQGLVDDQPWFTLLVRGMTMLLWLLSTPGDISVGWLGQREQRSPPEWGKREVDSPEQP